MSCVRGLSTNQQSLQTIPSILIEQFINHSVPQSMNTISFLVLPRFQMVYLCFDLYSPVIDHLVTICLPSFVLYSLLSIPFDPFFATSTVISVHSTFYSVSFCPKMVFVLKAKAIFKTDILIHQIRCWDSNLCWFQHRFWLQLNLIYSTWWFKSCIL